MFWFFQKAHPFLLVLMLSAATVFSAKPAESDLNKEGWRLYRLGEFKAAVEVFEALRSSGQPGSEAEINGLSEHRRHVGVGRSTHPGLCTVD